MSKTCYCISSSLYNTEQDCFLYVFQYKFLSGTLPCTYNLSVSGNYCSTTNAFFGNGNETIEHLFHYCSQSKTEIHHTDHSVAKQELPKGLQHNVPLLQIVYYVYHSRIGPKIPTNLELIILYAKRYMYTCNLATRRFFFFFFFQQIWTVMQCQSNIQNLLEIQMLEIRQGGQLLNKLQCPSDISHVYLIFCCCVQRIILSCTFSDLPKIKNK